MEPIAVPAFENPETRVKQYSRFKGLDYSTDETQIDEERSPRAVNMIADEGGFPEKRPGWRTVLYFGSSDCRVSGIFPFENDGSDDYETFIVHAGDRLCSIKLDKNSQYVEGSKFNILALMRADKRDQGFYMNGKLYILTGRDYIVCDGKTAMPVSDDNAYVPITSYQRTPEGGGQTQDRVNMLCKYRKNRFIGDGKSRTFKLDAEDIDVYPEPEAKYFITGETLAIESYDKSKGTVTFKTAPAAPLNAGTSNVEIKFAKTTKDREKILGCTIFAIYGIDGASNRVFLSGNPDYAATEWYSGLSDPTYFPDQNYSVVGSSDFPIMCYLKAQGELLIIKQDNRQEGTIWHHTGTITGDVAAFPLKEGVPGYGAAARYSAANLNDDPLYLSPRGVYAPTTTYYNNMQVRQLFCRSRRVNPKLCKESGLENAISAVWRGWYVLVIDGRAYVADGNQKREDDGYEWYYWTNIPAHTLCAHKQTLYFGTKDGRLCRFNDDMVSDSNEILMKAYNDDGQPIRAEWATKFDTMGSLSRLKTMPKRGSSVHLKAYSRSLVTAWIRTEADRGRMYREIYADRINFEDINFERFTFRGSVNTIVPFLIKKKKWKAIQVILISNALNEGFGVYEIEIKYTYAGEARR